MRRLVQTLFVLIISCLNGQNKQVLYGFSEIPQSLLLNPGGKVNYNGHFGLPLLSHFHINGGSSGPTIYDLFADNNVNFNQKLRNVIDDSKSTDFFTTTQQLEIAFLGFRVGRTFEKKGYISFGMYQELDAITYIPKDYAILTLEGNQNNINRLFKASDLSLESQLISVFHLGYNYKVNNKFTYGLRGKIYSSVFNARSINNKGGLVTTAGQNNIYRHNFNLDMELSTSGFANLDDDDGAQAIGKRFLFGGNLGLGLDLGFSYQFDEQLSVDASLLDIGFIMHNKGVENYKIDGTFVYEGIDPFFSELDDTEGADDVWGNIEDEFEELFAIDTTTNAYTSWRPLKLNASINYAFGKKKEDSCNCIAEEAVFLNAIGAQLYAIRRPQLPQLALTLYYYRRLFDGLRAKFTYTIDSYSYSNLGFGLSAHIKGLNFYVMADNFLQYRNIYDAQSVSLQLGFNYIFNKNED